MEDRVSPRKPPITPAPVVLLVAHYHSQLQEYNAAVAALCETGGRSTERRMADMAMEPIAEGAYVDKGELVELIRRQNHRLGRHIVARAKDLLLEHRTGEDGAPLLNRHGYSVGYSYSEILDLLAIEFPEASTSAACLRWYVVHMRSDARDEGKPWPDLPKFRPRSPASKKGA